jgi:hydrogenase nickel incorporation protein HypA/HybF
MHELAIAMGIVDSACESARGARVRRVVVAVGALTAVFPDALLFCFDAAAQGTDVEGAELEIRPVAAVADCRACGVRTTTHRVMGLCACGSADLSWMSGNELRVVEMEVE